MAETATVQIAMPEMGESVTEGIVLEWHVAEGDFVSEGDTVVEVSTDKVDAEVPAPMDGVITKLLVAVDDEVPVGAPMAEMEAGEGSSEGSGASGCGRMPGGDSCGRGRGFVLGSLPLSSRVGPATGPAHGRCAGNGSADVRATPVARRVAEATGVDLASVSGSGPGPRSPRRTCWPLGTARQRRCRRECR